MHSVSTTNTWTVCIHFSSTASLAKFLSGVNNSLIICRGQLISTSKTVRLRNKISSMTEKKIYKMSVINLKGKSSVDIFHPTKSNASAHCWQSKGEGLALVPKVIQRFILWAVVEKATKMAGISLHDRTNTTTVVYLASDCVDQNFVNGDKLLLRLPSGGNRDGRSAWVCGSFCWWLRLMSGGRILKLRKGIL